MAGAWGYWTTASIVVGTITLLPFIMALGWGFFRGNRFNVQGKTLVLTGASEGMGKSVARQLAAKGANIVIVARSVAKLEEALAEIKAAASSPSQRFHYISADLSVSENSTRVIAEATAWNNGESPDVVWCMAGSAYPKLFIETSISKLQSQMDMNYFTAAYMAHATLKEWLAPTSSNQDKERHLIFTSSVVAFYSVVGYAPYSPSKAALKSLSDTLAQEMLLYGGKVKIHTVFPGTIASAGNEVENLSKPDITHVLEESDPIQTPDEVARKSIAGLENGEYLITVGFLGSAMRACAWGGSPRNNWLVDTALTWVTSMIWGIIAWDLDGKVKKYGREHGHPSKYPKKVA